MITLYSGTPGSGKSYHAAKDLLKRFKRGGGIIANFPVSVPSNVSPAENLRVAYWDNSDITPQRLTAYALKYHKMGVEGQTLVVLDEAQVIFNCREFGVKDRKDWVKFFTQHRKLGFNMLLITQNDRMIDRQIRVLIENEVKHRKLNNYGFGGGLLQLLTLGRTWFIAIEYWYGGNKLLLSREIFPFRKSVSAIYDSYKMFDDSSGKNSLLALGGNVDPDLNLESIPKKRPKPFRKGGNSDDSGNGKTYFVSDPHLSVLSDNAG